MGIGSFFGHGDFRETDDLKCRIKSEIVDSIENRGIDTFYLGGYGSYDYCCARYINELKELYPHIKSYLIIPYLDRKQDEYDRQYIKETFDGTMFPPLEKVPLRFAISKRNEWIVNQSDYIFFYINRSWGGACKSFEMAIRKKKNFINFGTKKEW